MAIHLKADGDIRQVAPADEEMFTLDEYQAAVGGTVDWHLLPSGRCLAVNDNGKLYSRPMENAAASALWRLEYPIEKYPHNNDGRIVGDALLLTEEETRRERNAQ